MFQSIRTVHEVIYEYLDRLANLGILRNITPQRDTIHSHQKLFGRFEVMFDCFDPVVFQSEATIREFFQTHQLSYRYQMWHDRNSGKRFW